MLNLDGSCSYEDLLEWTQESPNTLHRSFVIMTVDDQRTALHPIQRFFLVVDVEKERLVPKFTKDLFR
jgi:hypothetical protein